MGKFIVMTVKLSPIGRGTVSLLGCQSLVIIAKEYKRTCLKNLTDSLPHDGVEAEGGAPICAAYYKAILDHMFTSTQFTQPVLDNNRYRDAKM